MKLDLHQRGALWDKLTENAHQIHPFLEKVKEAKGIDAIVEILKQYPLEVGNTSQLGVPENAPRSDGAPAHVITPLYDKEAAAHIKLVPLGVADTHPVAAIGDGIGSVAPDVVIPIGNVASDTSILIGDPSGSAGDSNSVSMGIIGDPSDSDDDSNSEGIGNGRGRRRGRGRGSFRDFIIGVLFLFMAMIAEFGPGLMQLAGSTHKHSLKLLLWGIDMSAAGCFFTSSCGLLGVFMRMADCRLFSRSSLLKFQKKSLIAASTFMMVAMIMVFVFIPVSMV
ncbi:hypothetical protein MKW98_019715 [Papaver atlanticum]|uniref:Uncharacterized protein n=1 Tax=Papaver atlanticum TaxID=357466 RepID=A0AAD4XWV1_9MAGN|nr:hypothetical protein MKW98_019715 [Papaver atlanticum]